jgi:putative holliday junction resolvase
MGGYVLALDVGERRIGVALASTIARIAAPLSTIDRRDETDAFAAIAKLVNENDAETVIVGLPRGMAGQETAQTAYSRDFAAELARHVTVPVVLQEETATSLAAEDRLKSRNKPYEKADIDAMAAAIILEDWLTGNLERTA